MTRTPVRPVGSPWRHAARRPSPVPDRSRGGSRWFQAGTSSRGQDGLISPAASGLNAAVVPTMDVGAGGVVRQLNTSAQTSFLMVTSVLTRPRLRRMRVVPRPVCQSSRWMSVAVTATSIPDGEPVALGVHRLHRGHGGHVLHGSIKPLPTWGGCRPPLRHGQFGVRRQGVTEDAGGEHRLLGGRIRRRRPPADHGGGGGRWLSGFGHPQPAGVGPRSNPRRLHGSVGDHRTSTTT